MAQKESNTALLTELYKYDPSAIVEMFELDLTPLDDYYFSINDVHISPLSYKFHNGTNYKGSDVPPTSGVDVVWNSQTYVARAIEFSGLETSTAGQLPRPTLNISNLDGQISALIKAYGGLAGAKVIRRRTLVKFLDATNFIGNSNATADPNAAFPTETFVIDRVAEETAISVSFELSVAWDVEGIKLPRRQVVANICPWSYKEDACTWKPSGRAYTFSAFSGTAVATTATYFIPRNNITLVSGAGNADLLALKIVRSGGTSYSTNTTYHVIHAGKGFTNGSQVKVPGNLLGGTTPTNDLTITISGTTGKYYDELDRDLDYIHLIEGGSALTETQKQERDKCGKRFTSCRVRFGESNLPFGGFPNAGLYGKPI